MVDPTPDLAAPAAPAPDPYQDHPAIVDRVTQKLTEWARGRETLVRAAYRNILYFRGHQWIVFDRTLNSWRSSRLKRNTPTPVTNRFAATLNALISVLARVEPQPKFPPATDDPEDQATADVADRVIEVIQDEVNLRVQRQFLATWNGLTGGAWLETGYDPDPIHGTRLLQHEECLTCGTVQPPSPDGACQGASPTTPGGPCGSRMLLPATDPATGAPIGDTVPIGKLYIDVVPIFEMFFDPAITDWRKQRQCCRRKSVSLEEAKARWGHVAEQIQPDSLSNIGEFYGDSLPTLGPNVEDVNLMRGMTTKPSSNTRVTEHWWWQMPDATYPEGLLAVVLGKSLVAYAGPLPYSALTADGTRQPFLPFVWFPQQLVPGSAWGKTVADDLAPKQAQRNRFESLAETTAMRTSNPVWIVPEGANVANFTGESGQIIKYNALGPAPAKPERIPGQNISATLIQMIEIIDRDFEEIAGTFDVIKGGRPEGISAGIALQILKERGESRFAPMFILWEDAWALWAQQALEIFREFATEERIQRIQGRDGSWQVRKFLGADLKGRINVVPEAASSFPKSTLSERAEVEQLMQFGVLSPADPETRFKLLELFGKADFAPGLAADTKNALMENEQFDQLAQDPRLAQIPSEYFQMAMAVPYSQLVQEFKGFGMTLPPIYPSLDDHAVHSREHGKFGKTERFRQYPPAIQFLLEKKKAEHDQYAQQALQAMQALRAAPGPGLMTTPAPSTQPQNAGSSGQRMQGDAREMADDLA